MVIIIPITFGRLHTQSAIDAGGNHWPNHWPATAPAVRSPRNPLKNLVGPGDVPLVCDFKQLRCPTAPNTHTERKQQFGSLSNLSQYRTSGGSGFRKIGGHDR